MIFAVISAILEIAKRSLKNSGLQRGLTDTSIKKKRSVCENAILSYFFVKGQPSIIFVEICVRESQTVLRTSVLRFQTAIDFFTKTSLTRGQGKLVPWFSEGILLQFLAVKRITWQFRMCKWFAGKFLEGNVQLAISEMKISFPKIFGNFNFQLRYPKQIKFF